MRNIFKEKLCRKCAPKASPRPLLISNSKLFADDTSLFSVVHHLNTSANEINNYLKKIETGAHQWKMSFNPDPLKQAQEVIFSRKRNKPHHLDIIFNGNPVKKFLPKTFGYAS